MVCYLSSYGVSAQACMPNVVLVSLYPDMFSFSLFVSVHYVLICLKFSLA